MHTAVLGTGLLGAAIALAAKGRGEDVVVWNRSHEKALALESQGLRVAATAGDAVSGASRVHVVLRDDDSVDEVLGSCRERLRGPLILDHTTNGPARTKQRADTLTQQGIEYLHAPVFMGPEAARAAKGSLVVSGPEALYEKGKAALEAMTGTVQYLGERPDLAAVYKLMGNSLLISLTAGLADLFALGRAQGVDAQAALKLFDVLNPGAVTKGKATRMASGEFDATFELQMARKDVRLMVEAAETGEVPLQLLPVIASWMDRVIGAGLGRHDYSSLAYEAVLGREPPAPPSVHFNTSN